MTTPLRYRASYPLQPQQHNLVTVQLASCSVVMQVTPVRLPAGRASRSTCSNGSQERITSGVSFTAALTIRTAFRQRR